MLITWRNSAAIEKRGIAGQYPVKRDIGECAVAPANLAWPKATSLGPECRSTVI